MTPTRCSRRYSRPGPLTSEQRSDLNAFVGHVQNPPENDITRLDPGVVRQGMVVVTALIAATSREINPAALRQRSQAAIEMAEAALRMPGADGEADGQVGAAWLGLAIEAARDAVEMLPERRLGVAEVDDFRRAMDAVTDLETATKQVISTATAALDGLRPQVAGRRDRCRGGAALTAAAQALLARIGRQQAALSARLAALSTRLDQAAEELRQRRPGWWPADGADLTTVAELQAVTQALEGDASRQIEAARDAVIQVATEVVTEANRVLRERARSIVELARAARALLPYTGDDEQAALTSALDDAIARGAPSRGTGSTRRHVRGRESGCP